MCSIYFPYSFSSLFVDCFRIYYIYKLYMRQFNCTKSKFRKILLKCKVCVAMAMCLSLCADFCCCANRTCIDQCFYHPELIPRPARACPDPPLYLRLRMGRPIGKSIPLPTSVMSYGKNKLRPEFWFSIPKNRTDELYRFINTWVPHLYGDLDEEQIAARGFEMIQHDTEWTKGEHNRVND